MVPVRKSRVQAPPAECPLSLCMGYLAGAWTAHIIWYLSETPRRFSELKGDIRGVSAKVLSARLRQLEQSGLVLRRTMPTSPPTVEYALTPLGHELQPVIAAIVAVGHRLKQQQGDDRAAASPSRRAPA